MGRTSNMLAEMADININAGVKKSNLPLLKMIILGMMAGAFIAFGGAASNVVVHGIDNAGVAKMLAGVIFPVGLMLVVFTGSELFTGNCLMIMGALDKKIKVSKMIRNLVIVYFSNLLGALIMDFLIFYSGQFDLSSGGLGAYTIKVAIGKTSLAPSTAFVSGILCNILVCLAILMSSVAKEVISKIFAVFFPICLFVVCGFEHCVANMFYLPSGILATTNPQYVAKAKELFGITAQQCENLKHFAGTDQLIYVTLGNIVGGMLLVGAVFYFVHIRNRDKKNS